MNPQPSPVDRPWLVAHDFSRCADAAADLALTDLLPMRKPTRIVLVHAYAPPTPPATPLGVVMPTPDDGVRVSAQRALEAVAARLRGRWLEETGAETPVHIDVAVSCGSPAPTILAEAKRVDAARIFVGTHGRRGVGRMLLGSVAERVVRLAEVPVVVVHALDEATERAA